MVVRKHRREDRAVIEEVTGSLDRANRPLRPLCLMIEEYHECQERRMTILDVAGNDEVLYIVDTDS